MSKMCVNPTNCARNIEKIFDLTFEFLKMIFEGLKMSFEREFSNVN